MLITNQKKTILTTILILYFAILFFSCTKPKYIYVCNDDTFKDKIFIIIEGDKYDRISDIYFRATPQDLTFIFETVIPVKAGPHDYIELKGKLDRKKFIIKHNELLENLAGMIFREHHELLVFDSINGIELEFIGEKDDGKYFKNKKIIPYEQEGLYLDGVVTGICVKDDRKIDLRVKMDDDYEFYDTISYSSQGLSIARTDKDDKRNSTSRISGNYDTGFKSNYTELCRQNKKLIEENPELQKLIEDDVERRKRQSLFNPDYDKFFDYDCLCFNKSSGSDGEYETQTVFYTIRDGDHSYETRILKMHNVLGSVIEDVLRSLEPKTVDAVSPVDQDSYLLLIYDSYTDTTWANIFDYKNLKYSLTR
jgi:hypothetical protein